MCLFTILTGIPALIHRYGYHGNRVGTMVTVQMRSSWCVHVCVVMGHNRPGKEHGGLGRQDRLPSIDCCVQAPLKRRFTTGMWEWPDLCLLPMDLGRGGAGLGRGGAGLGINGSCFNIFYYVDKYSSSF